MHGVGPENMHLAVVSVIGPADETIPVFFSFMASESELHWLQVLRDFVESCAVDGAMQRLPGVLVCDDDSNLHRAAAIVWPSIFVILCVWHFKKNIRKKVSLILGTFATEFCTRVSNLLSANSKQKYATALAALDDPTLQWNHLSGANADNIADAICLCKSVASKQAPCFLDIFRKQGRTPL